MAPLTDNFLGYFVDTLFRPTDTGTVAAAGQNDASAIGQATRILITSSASGQVSADDKTYLTRLVASRTGLSETDAKTRVDTVLANLEAARNKAKATADTVRKASASFALLGALSLVIGAFIASVAAAVGGMQRDEEEALFARSNDVQHPESSTVTSTPDITAAKSSSRAWVWSAELGRDH